MPRPQTPKTVPLPPTTLVIGSGVTEHVLTIEGDVRLGQKHRAHRRELLGGSGLSYFLRLLSSGRPALPILPIGDDSTGNRIRQHAVDLIRRHGYGHLEKFFDRNDFLLPHVSTPQSSILVSRDSRTIFTTLPGDLNSYREALPERVRTARRLAGPSLKVIAFGHIYTDSPNLISDTSATSTASAIRQFDDLSPDARPLVYVNFGDSQLRYGCKAWEPVLPPGTIVHLSLVEARRFVNLGDKTATLNQILDYFRSRAISVIITLDKFGAIASFREGADGLILAWPHETVDIVDTTGAGDAFGAGVISELCGKPVSLAAFLTAIKQARYWAAFACTTLGGANECPDADTLRAFGARLSKSQPESSVELRSAQESQRILWLLDKAYPS